MIRFLLKQTKLLHAALLMMRAAQRQCKPSAERSMLQLCRGAACVRRNCQLAPHSCARSARWAATIILTLFTAATAWATTNNNISYIDANGNPQTASRVDVVNESMDDNDYLFASSNGWLYVNSDVTLTKATNNGTMDTNIILGDGATLTINGWTYFSGVSLTIYCQSGRTGKLVINGTYSNDCIFGIARTKKLTINGGIVEVTNTSGHGYGGGTLIMNGGTATFTGSGYGIYTNVIFNGGNLTVNGSGIDERTTLNYKSESDRIMSNGYNGDVTVVNGKVFKDVSGNFYSGTLNSTEKSAIAGKTLQPATDVYAVNIGSLTNGRITANRRGALSGETVTLTVTPSTHYEIGTVSYNDGSDHEITPVGGVYSFTMPAANVVVSATFNTTSSTPTGNWIDYKATETLPQSEDGETIYISTAEQLALYAYNVNHDVQNSKGYYCARNVELQADIDLSAHYWIPIGYSSSHYFNGNFNGNGHKITGLNININDGTKYEYVGLFGYYYTGSNGSRSITDLTIADFSIDAPSSRVVGAIAGIGYSDISNCFVVNGSITASEKAGCIAGHMNGTLSGNYYANCTVNISNTQKTTNIGAGNYSSDNENIKQLFTITVDNGIIVSATATKTYNETNFYASGTAVTATATVPSTGMKKFTATGTTASFSETLGQYTFTMPTNDVTVSLADFTPTITVAGGSTYNGNAQTPAITSVMDGETVMTLETDYTNVAYSNNTNAGDATVTITGKGFYLGTASQTFTINPASVTLTANSRNTDIYDGTEKTVTGYTSSVDGLTFAETITASGSGTNAGNYDVTFSGVTLNDTKDNTGNYVVTGTTKGTLTINPASVTLTANSDTKAYTGAEQTVTGFTSNVNGLTFTGVSASGSGTNTGNYDVTFTGVSLNTTKDDTGNYVVTGTTNGTLTITAKTVTDNNALTITQDENGYYATFTGSANDEVSIPDAITVKSVTLNRDFSNGKYATLMLPFSLNANEQTGQTLTGANIYQFVGVTKVNGQWIATMQTPTSPLQANTPYLVEPVINDLTNEGHLTFNLNGGTVTLQTGASNDNSSDTNWHFKGTYQRLTYGTAPMTGYVYGFASADATVEGKDVKAGEFVYATTGAAVPPLRCYLIYGNNEQYSGARAMTRGGEEMPKTIIVRLVSGGETTNIGTLDTSSGEVSFDGWYTLDGIKLDSKPTKKGLYINNGRKIVIK